MSDISIHFHALLWFMVAAYTLGFAALGVVVQPALLWLFRRGPATSRAQKLGYVLGPLLAAALCAGAVWVGANSSESWGARLDAWSPLLPVAALALWVSSSVALLRRR